MPMISRSESCLVVIDLQAKLMPAIEGAEAVIANAGRLLKGAHLFGVPTLATEQNPTRLGSTVDGVELGATPVLAKMHFDATADDAVREALWLERTLLLTGCEAHVCVLQTALGLADLGARVVVVEDAVGSRAPANKAAALARLRADGIEIATTEMVLFEWAESAEDPAFKSLLSLVK
ncbi:MAG: isochorismatase family protein [Pseudomonadota bacterium]